MIYASRYKSPIGNILLASDEEGLTGLDRNILQIHFQMKEFYRKRRFSEKQKNGWICILPEKNPHLRHLCIQQDQHSDRQCGSSYCRFPMGRRSHMERLLAGWLK